MLHNCYLYCFSDETHIWLILTNLWANSADNSLMFFLFCFPENRLWHLIQTICIYCQSIFWEKYEKHLSKCRLLKFYPACIALTHCSLETSKRVIGKQCRPRSDATECGIKSGSPLFADSSVSFLQKLLNHIHSLIYLKPKLKSSNI